MTTRDAGLDLRLLQLLLDSARGGRVFTSEEAVAQGAGLGLSPSHTYKLLSELTDRHLLERPRTRLYVMQPPFGGLSPVRAIAIAVHAVRPSAVSGESALVHWGLLAQALIHEEVVSTPARLQWKDVQTADGQDRLWHVAGSSIRFRHVSPTEMFGTTTVRLDAETIVPIFDRERTILEILLRPAAGGAAWAAEILREHRQEVQVERLRSYARHAGATAALSRALAPRAAASDRGVAS